MNDNNNDDNILASDNHVELQIETTLSKEKRLECRQIISEIKNFRVSQRQVLYLIQLLAYELEDRDKMVAITDAVKNVRKDLTENVLELPEGFEV